MNEEHYEQVQLFKWIRSMDDLYPELQLLFAVPNAGKRGMRQNKKGQWYSPGGQWMKAEGLTKGVPDVWFPVPRGNHPGLVIEMKSSTGSLTPEQKKWLNLLSWQGWSTHVCRSWQEAVNIIMTYLLGDKWNNPL